MIKIILVSLLIMSTSLIGIFTFFKPIHDFIDQRLNLLFSFATGVFISVIFGILFESFHQGNLIKSVFWLLIGALITIIISKIIPDYHHHHSANAEHSHTKQSSFRILLSDGIHNIADGILITSAILLNNTISIGVVIGIMIHELVQEISEFFILKEAGNSNIEAITKSFLVSTTIFIGSIGSFYLFNVFKNLDTIFLGLAAGSFLTALIQDLIPNLFDKSSAIISSNNTKFFIAIIAGILLMILVSNLDIH